MGFVMVIMLADGHSGLSIDQARDLGGHAAHRIIRIYASFPSPVIDDAGKIGQFTNHGSRSDFLQPLISILGDLGLRCL
jgi:hypothetical protein